MTVSEVLEPVTDFIKKQSRLTLTVVSLLILFTISGIIVVCIQSSKDTRKKTLAPYDETFVPIDEIYGFFYVNYFCALAMQREDKDSSDFALIGVFKFLDELANLFVADKKAFGSHHR